MFSVCSRERFPWDGDITLRSVRDGTTLRDDGLRDDGLRDDGLRNGGLVVCRWRLEDDEIRGGVRGENRSISSFMLSVGINRAMSANVV
jgi:hypothetical protein